MASGLSNLRQGNDYDHTLLSRILFLSSSNNRQTLLICSYDNRATLPTGSVETIHQRRLFDNFTRQSPKQIKSIIHPKKLPKSQTTWSTSNNNQRKREDQKHQQLVPLEAFSGWYSVDEERLNESFPFLVNERRRKGDGNTPWIADTLSTVYPEYEWKRWKFFQGKKGTPNLE